MLAALQHGPVTVVYVPHRLVELYAVQGWHLTAMPMPHAAYAMMAWRAG